MVTAQPVPEGPADDVGGSGVIRWWPQCQQSPLLASSGLGRAQSRGGEEAGSEGVCPGSKSGLRLATGSTGGEGTVCLTDECESLWHGPREKSLLLCLLTWSSRTHSHLDTCAVPDSLGKGRTSLQKAQ